MKIMMKSNQRKENDEKQKTGAPPKWKSNHLQNLKQEVELKLISFKSNNCITDQSAQIALWTVLG